MTKHCIALIAAHAIMSATLATAHAQEVDVRDLAFVTDDDATRNRGCDAVAIVDVRNGLHVFDGQQHVSPGRIAITSDASWIVSQSNNGGSFLMLLERLPGLSSRWDTTSVGGRFVLG